MSQRPHPSRRVPAWRRALGRAVRRGDERGSMPLALLLTVVAAGLSGVLSVTVVQQIDATRTAEDRVQALSVAQAGLDVALARIRAAVDGAGGDREKLPCGPIEPPSGVLPVGSKYQVTVDYLVTDPQGHQTDASWIAQNRLPCSTGPSVTPAYALLRSTGTRADVAGTARDADSRTLHATYTLSTTDENLPGGRITLWGNKNLCLGSLSAPAESKGKPLYAVPCSSDWRRIYLAYPTTLQLRLVQSRSAAYPEGLCVHAENQAQGTAVTFEPCADEKEPRQRWRFSADRWYYEGTVDNKTGSAACLGLTLPNTVNSPVIVTEKGTDANCGVDAPSKTSAFFPTPDVGPGSAGPITKQLVNYGEVGRCLDLPDDDVTGVKSKGISPNEGLSLITYPCKQNFSGLPHWNHVFTYPEVASDGSTVSGTISVTPGIPVSNPPESPDPEWNIPYCLKSPGPAGGYVWVTKCQGAPADTVTWNFTGKTEQIETSYRIVDEYGMCLQSLGPDATPADKHNDWIRVATTECSEDPEKITYQKWNVPVTLTAAPLKDYGEQ